MKLIKRIFAVLLLIVILLTVGYLRFTGSRLSSNFDGDDYEEVTFEETNTDNNTDKNKIYRLCVFSLCEM